MIGVHKLIINKLGPMERCELDCSAFMALTGFQASGKSTVAKAVFYFRTIKEDIVELVKRQSTNVLYYVGAKQNGYVVPKMDLRKGLENHLRDKFLSIFGSSWGMSNAMYMEYHFTETCFVRISLKEDTKYQTPNYIWITLSRELKEFLQAWNDRFPVTPLGVPEEQMSWFKKELYQLFDDPASVVYIPAGRSMITLLSQQLNYIYAQMDDVQKRAMDGCTKDYLERILRIRPEFSEGLRGLAARSLGKNALPKELVGQALELAEEVLRGTYRYNDGEEQIVLADGRYVKLNFSSSGQQECVWILNLLFYYMLQQNRILFIIEEPESHLFPESQKYITEFIALVNNCGHSVMLTTHSPYVLGTLNNLLYAHTVLPKYAKEACRIIPEAFWLDFNGFQAWFVKEGIMEGCMDPEIHMIQNERIDQISKVINGEFDQLVGLQDTEGEGVVS